MIFNVSFENRERRVKTKSDRKRVLGLYNRETEGLATMDHYRKWGCIKFYPQKKSSAT